MGGFLDAPSTPALRGLLAGLAVAAALANRDTPVQPRGVLLSDSSDRRVPKAEGVADMGQLLEGYFGPAWRFALCVATAKAGEGTLATGTVGAVATRVVGDAVVERAIRQQEGVSDEY